MSKSGSAPPPAPLTRKQLSRAQRERQQRRYIVIASLVVFGLVLAIILFGVFDQTVLRPRQPVARVNDTQITRDEFVKAARFQRYQLVAQYGQTAQMAQLFATDEQTQQFFVQQLQQIALQLSDPATLGRSTIDGLVNDELIRQEAARRGISVTREEVDQAYREFFGFYPDGTPTPTQTGTLPPTWTATAPPPATATPDATQAAQLTAAPTLTPTETVEPTATLEPTATITPTATSTPGPSPTATATRTETPTATPFTTQGFATVEGEFRADLRQQTGMTEADLRRYFETRLLREKLVEMFAEQTATTAEFVRARHILLPDLETALSMQAELAAGADFAELAELYSLDTTSAVQGGDLDWFTRGMMVPEFEEAAFSLPVGQVSEPVQTQFGFHIIEVVDREERPLDAAALAEAREQALSDWLAAQRPALRPDGRPVVQIHDNWLGDVPTRPALPTG
jgi:peptidyl-prolyl cis-trans isomerase D